MYLFDLQKASEILRVLGGPGIGDIRRNETDIKNEWLEVVE
ncbi:24481_t:CDS:2, partial [Gigaspora rosea]